MLSNHFPPDVRDALARAGAVPVMSSSDPARIRAIDRATAAARLRYPELFRTEEEPVEATPEVRAAVADLFGGS